jgi:hypothetical protein
MLNAHSVPVSSEAAGYSVVKVRREKKFPSLTPIYRAFREPVFEEKSKKTLENRYEE